MVKQQIYQNKAKSKAKSTVFRLFLSFTAGEQTSL